MGNGSGMAERPAGLSEARASLRSALGSIGDTRNALGRIRQHLLGPEPPSTMGKDAPTPLRTGMVPEVVDISGDVQLAASRLFEYVERLSNELGVPALEMPAAEVRREYPAPQVERNLREATARHPY